MHSKLTGHSFIIGAEIWLCRRIIRDRIRQTGCAGIAVFADAAFRNAVAVPMQDILPELPVRQVIETGAGGTFDKKNMLRKAVHRLCVPVGFGAGEIGEAFAFALIGLTGTVRHTALESGFGGSCGQTFQFILKYQPVSNLRTGIL